MKKDFWIVYNTVANLVNHEIWDHYLIELEKVLDDRLEKLDTNDPVRRIADTSKSEGKYIVDFKKDEESRWIFGRFKKSKIRLQIWFFKRIDHRSNTIEIKFPDVPRSDAELRKIMQVFDFGNTIFSPFYSYADMTEVIFSKTPCTPSLDISRELLGVFWLTYFGPEYCDFFGDKILLNKFRQDKPKCGITLKLGDTPAMVNHYLRSDVEAFIGIESFANGPPVKEQGQFALTLQQLVK